VGSTGDSDGDGVPDTSDQCPGADDRIDVDNDGIPDCKDTLIDSDRDGVADNIDMCLSLQIAPKQIFFS
jgi:thrombospondin type 3 repeat protein